MNNAAENIERALTTSILRGEFSVGARLPTVRELAIRFEVNPSTVHRALKGLETTRLVTARRGSGVVINDPHLVSDLSLIPAWIEALLDKPNQAAKFLAELLQMRRLVAADLAAVNREKLLKRKNDFLPLMQSAEQIDKNDIDAMRKADFDIMTLMLSIVGNTVGQLSINIMPQVFQRIPEVEQACYYWAQNNPSLPLRIIDLLQSETDPWSLRKKMDMEFSVVDQTSVKRFKYLLNRRLKKLPPKGR